MGAGTMPAGGKFKPTLASLLDYECPQWFRDAKFGIYLHWGAYSVAERGEWYARNLYLEGHPDYLHHLEHYGHPSEFGYKDFIPLWKAENWDPDGLLALFKRAGAQYFTPCAVHHDNFDLWNSKHHRWNSVNMGPQKDITGIWREATLKGGLRFGVTTHLARSYSWFNPSKGADRSGPKKGVPYDGNNPECRDFYHEPHPDIDRRQPANPPESWRRLWAARIRDLIESYHPDHLYFDGCIPFRGEDQGRTGMEAIAHFYNHNIEVKGQLEGVMCIKRHEGGTHGVYHPGVATLDIERRRADEILPEPWQTDTSIGPWGYRAGAVYRPAQELIHELVDIVSKNGNVLLNVPPRADGTLDDETVARLEGIGEWLRVNGEAIYGTRPWLRHADGDVRFTRKNGVLYAIALSWPEPGRVLGIRSLARTNGVAPMGRITLLGGEDELRWGHDQEMLRVVIPEKLPSPHAIAFRIEFE